MTDVCPVVKFGKHVSMADMITEHGISAVNTRPVHAKQMQVRGKVMGQSSPLLSQCGWCRARDFMLTEGESLYL